MKDLTEGLKELATKYKAFTLKWEPDIKSDDKEFRKIVEKLGFRIKDDGKDFGDGIQPRYVFRLNIKDKTEEEIFSDFHQKTRYNIRLATKKGVVIKEGKKEMKKVKWPTRKDMVKYSIATLSIILFFCLFFVASDLIIMGVKELMK